MLLDDIIAILSDSTGSLTDALLKTKVLLYQIGKKDLVPWVTSELTGYRDFSNLPPYRIVAASPHASLTSIAWQINSWRLPIGHLEEKDRKHICEAYIDLSIQSIEETVRQYRGTGKGGLHRPLDPALASLFRKTLEPGVNIISLWCEVSMPQVEAILDQVRSRLLDFALELKEALGTNTPIEDLPRKAEQVKAERIFNQTIYNQGTLIIGGQNIQVNNQQGDIDGLLGEVAKLGYSQAELDDLRRAVLEDKSNDATPAVTGGETGKWYTSALKKVGHGAVNVGVEVATRVIIEALKHYSGA